MNAKLFLFALITMSGCASLPPGVNFPKTASTALEHPETTRLGRLFADGSAAHAGLSALRLVPVGVDSFLLRTELIDRAEKTLDLQYYIFRFDVTGQQITEAVLRAADRGVRVRLLIDDIDNTGQNADMDALAAHPNIEVRVYNPLAYRGEVSLLRWAEIMIHEPRLNYRMHNKLMVVDNAVALIGGRNVGDDYFQADLAGQLGDIEVFAGGPIVPSLSKSFDEFWHSTLAIPVAALATGPIRLQALADYRRELALHYEKKPVDNTDYATLMRNGEPFNSFLDGRLPLVWARATLWYDSPERGWVETKEKSGQIMRWVIFEAAAAARSEVIMISAYLIPGEDGMALFDDLHRRSISALALTNSMESDTGTAAFAGYAHFRPALLADQVQLYEIRALHGSVSGTGKDTLTSSYGDFGLHTKLYIFDREKIFIGSMNFDQRSFHLNTELGLMIESPELAREGAAIFEGLAQPANSYHVLLASPTGANNQPWPGPPRMVWRTLENGQPVDYFREPARNVWQRFKVQVLSLLPMDTLL